MEWYLEKSKGGESNVLIYGLVIIVKHGFWLVIKYFTEVKVPVKNNNVKGGFI